MFLFPCIYLFSFLIALYRVCNGKPESILYFFIFGLSIYITSLSLFYYYGFGKLIIPLQICKEAIVLITLATLLFKRKEKIVLQKLDKLLILFLLYTFIYVFLPLGSFGFVDKFLAFKSLSFFPFIYFTGRLVDPKRVDINKCFSLICLISIAAAVVLIGEVVLDEHLQNHTGYANFTERFFGQDVAGNFGLTWTFETSNGLKRFAGFFSQPLEMGTNTLLSLCVIAALSTTDENKLQPNRLSKITFFFTLICILFAVSRASFVSYFIIIYIYALVTGSKLLLRIFNYCILLSLILFLFFLKGDIYDFIAGTIDFSDSSSAFHVFQWLDGIEALKNSPLGIGMGMSGRVSAETGSNIGGENQFIIIGVQTGIIAVSLYIAIYAYTIHLCFGFFKKTKGKIRKLALALLLIKIGMIIPSFTTNAESYLYISYMTWFLTGLMVNILAIPDEKKQ